MNEAGAALPEVDTVEEDDLVRSVAPSRHVPEADLEAASQIAESPTTHNPANQQDTIIVVDFGSQYSRLIARRVREAKVYCEVLPHNTAWGEMLARNPQGFILSGGPASVYDEGAPQPPPELYASGIPILGICYGMQLMALAMGGKVAPSTHREFGPAELEFSRDPAYLPEFQGAHAFG